MSTVFLLAAVCARRRLPVISACLVHPSSSAPTMAKTAEDVCAFCGQKEGGELGGLQNTSDETILAHHDCLIFSPLVFTNNKDKFDVDSVWDEIKRGKALKCSHCKNPGATIGCDVRICRKTYHYACVQKDGGVTDEENYIVYCSKHTKNSKAAKGSGRPKKPDHSPTSQEKEKSVKKKNLSTLGKRKRESAPGEPENRKRKNNDDEQDSEGSEISELPSTSYGKRTPRRSRNSDPGAYSIQLSNKKNTAAQEIERSSSASSPSSDETPQKTKRRSEARMENDTSTIKQLSIPLVDCYLQKTPSIRLNSSESVNRTRSTEDHSEDEQTDTNDGSSGVNFNITVSASPVTRKNWHGKSHNQRKSLGASSTQNTHNSSDSVDQDDLQLSDGDVEREVLDAQVRGAESEEMDEQAECNKESTSSPSQPILNVCFPGTCQGYCDIHEEFFSKLYESQSRVADSIDNGVREFRNFVQQFQSMFKQFLDICQSLNNGVISNLTNTQGQNTTMEGNQREDASSLDPLPPSQLNAHVSASTHDSAKGGPEADTLSSENTHPSTSEEPIRKARFLLVKKHSKRS